MSSRSGFVAVVGRPNVGKSSLVNALVGQKVTITSSRPQTTRSTVRGVLTTTSGDGSAQMVFVDTPGLHKPRTALGERLNDLVYGTLADSEAVLFLLDATQEVGPGDRLIGERVASSGAPVILVVTKTDIAKPTQIAQRLVEAEPWDFAAYVPTSAVTGDGTEALVEELVGLLPEGPQYFPTDQVTDQPDEWLIAEIIREKFLDRLREELPHSLAVVVREMEPRPNGTLYVDASLIVERDSQKGIVIGKNGSVLAASATEARAELERIFATKMYLDLHVRVEPDWQRSPELLDRLGF